MINLDGSELNLGGKIIRLSGLFKIQQVDQIQYEMLVETDQLILSRRGELFMRVNPSNVRLQKKPGSPPAVTGGVQFTEFRFTKPIYNVDPISLFIRNGGHTPKSAPNLVNNIRLDMQVVAIGNKILSLTTILLGFHFQLTCNSSGQFLNRDIQAE